MLFINRNTGGIWQFNKDSAPKGWNPHYFDALPRYLTFFDEIHQRAKDANEFEFIMAVLGVNISWIEDVTSSKGIHPYDTTRLTIPRIANHLSQVKDDLVGFTLSLWIYGHIIESSEPYERIANLLNIIEGKRYAPGTNFPKMDDKGPPPTPGKKIATLRERIKTIPDLKYAATLPMDEFYDRELRNAIFHSDYVITRTWDLVINKSQPTEKLITYPALLQQINKALAFYESIQLCLKHHIQTYTAPKVIDVDKRFSDDPEEKAQVIVSKNHGLVGIKDNWTVNQIAAGKIPFRVARLAGDGDSERNFLVRHPYLAILPERKNYDWGCISETNPRGLGKYFLELQSHFKPDSMNTIRKRLHKLARDILFLKMV